MSNLCDPETSTELKRRGFQVAARIARSKVRKTDRQQALRTLAKCDPVAAEKLLGTLGKDATIGRDARDLLNEMKNAPTRK